MLRYNQRTPFRNTGGYSIESYEPDNQQEEKPLNQTFFNYPLVNMENTRNNISLNQTNIVPQYVEPNKTLTNPRYISNPTINQFNPANLSYSLQYNKNNGINPSYTLNNQIITLKRNPIITQYNQKTKYVYPIRTLDTINYGKQFNIPSVNFMRVQEPIIRSKTSNYLTINRRYPYVNKPTLNVNMPLNVKIVRPNAVMMKTINPIYQNIVVRRRHII